MTKTNVKKFSLDAAPTFPCVVDIPVPGAGTSPVEFKFKHRTKEQFKEFFDTLKTAGAAEGDGDTPGAKDVDVLLDIAAGWDLAEPFDAANLQKMADNYMGAPQAIIQAYFAELIGARVKN